jgi:hypothetical protein
MRSPFDIAELVTRCAEAPLALAQSPQSEPAFPPATPGLRQSFDDFAGARGAAAAASEAEHRRRFPPHLYPPESAQPFVLRTYAAFNIPTGVVNVVGTQVIPSLTWYVPRGQRYTTTRLHCDITTPYTAPRVGCRISRDNREWFMGGPFDIRYRNGVTTHFPAVGQVGINYATDFVGDGGDAHFECHFPSTFLPGERIDLELVLQDTHFDCFLIAIRVEGYLYADHLAVL